jgi:NAD(P)-dependent dehydrogenase (short-subunit alcohol dehydrogenase family)
MTTIAQLITLAGRRALISGGAGHIAGAAAETLVELGARVALLDRDAEGCRARAEKLSAARAGAAFALVCDLEDEAATRRAVRDATDALGGLDVLIHCAAYTGMTRMPGWSVGLDRQTATAFEASLRVNLTAAFVMVQEARGALTSGGHGSVVLFSSIYGLVGPDMRLYEGTSMSNSAGYGAAKGGILQLTRYLATVLAPAVRVNAITPGGVWRGQVEAFHERYRARTPLGRMATEEDLKGAVAYLASDLSAYVTGHNLVVDGGWTAW